MKPFLSACLGLLLACPAHANDAPTVLKQAQQQLATHDYPALATALAPLLAEAEPPLEALFLSGMAASQQQDYPRAIAAFRAMLTRDPTLVRPRLELARALQLAGDRAAARYHYEQALAGGLPEQVVRNIFRQLFDIREREPSFSLTLDLTSDSNPRQSTNNEIVIIGGLPYRLNDGNRAETVYGISASAEASLPLPSDPSWFARVVGEASEYPGQQLDSHYLQASVGKRLQRGADSVSLEAGGQLSRYQGRAQYSGGLVRGGGFLRFSPALGSAASVQYRSFDYDELPYLNGFQVAASLAGIYVPSPAERWELTAGYSVYQAAEDAYSYRQPSLAARYQRELPGGWIAGVRTQFVLADYQGDDPFFGETRRDREGRVELDLLNRKIKWWSFSPRALVGYVVRDSNLELYQYSRAYARVGLTKEF